MNLVFIGSTNFSLKCLNLCLDIPNLKVTGVITSPRIFSISYQPNGVTNVLHANISSLTKSKNIPIYEIKEKMNDPKLFETVVAWKPDAFLVSGWYHMIPKRFRELAPAYGLHASLLPDYSGGAPLTWAIINGEKKTGITLFQMDGGVDSGPLLGQKEEPIYQSDTIRSLYSRIEDRGVELLEETLPKIVNGNHKLEPQDESKRRLVPQRSPKDGVIDWTLPANRIHDFIRAQTRPYPGAFTYFGSRKVIIWESALLVKKDNNIQTGKLLMSKGCLLIGCGHNTILEIVLLAENNYDINPITWAKSKSFISH